MKRVYMAEDGKIFESQIECDKYETNIKNKSELREFLDKLEDFCETQSNCEKCLLYRENNFCFKTEFADMFYNKRTI